jgi:hypothetical protein
MHNVSVHYAASAVDLRDLIRHLDALAKTWTLPQRDNSILTFMNKKVQEYVIRLSIRLPLRACRAISPRASCSFSVERAYNGAWAESPTKFAYCDMLSKVISYG